MMSSKLKYLYTVVYDDGSTYTQNKDDISIKDPSKSCYSDLRLDDIATFTLTNGFHTYSINMIDGGFSIDGSVPFYMNTEPLKDYQLVYFRRVNMVISEDVRSMQTNYIMGYTANNYADTKVIHTIVLR